MIDIKFLRENPEVVKENIRKKFQDEKLSRVEEVIARDAESRKAKQEADDLRASSAITSSTRESFSSWNFLRMFSLTTSGFSLKNLMSIMTSSILPF